MEWSDQVFLGFPDPVQQMLDHVNNCFPREYGECVI